MKPRQEAAMLDAVLFAPARGRGLKRVSRDVVAPPSWFAPARGRGLKPRNSAPCTCSSRVRPRAGAWIETQSPS